ncbi:MAG: alpha/beta fold hydrolase [Azonexus sp.]|nr:alpha/beta fold hydrolase [Azonexus sp.]MBP9228018.1 alpha/beta fold hydrolase [Azonexus sp.]
MFQDHLLYFPTSAPLAEVVAEARRGGLEPWPDANDFRGLLRKPRAEARGTLVFFHGNAGHAGHRGWVAEALANAGLRVILAEYPGYGPRPGQPGEAALVRDAAETLARVREQFPGPLLVAGESLGAGVAAAVAKNSPDDLSGLLLITPWDSLKQVAHHHYPWAPVDLLLHDRYDNIANLAGFRGPVAVVIAAQDSIVPAPFGEALFASLPGPKRLWAIPASDHNDWMMQVDGKWWAAVTSFLLGG